MTTYDKSPTLGLNLPKGTDTFDYDVFLRQNFNTLDTSLADIATKTLMSYINDNSMNSTKRISVNGFYTKGDYAGQYDLVATTGSETWNVITVNGFTYSLSNDGYIKINNNYKAMPLPSVDKINVRAFGANSKNVTGFGSFDNSIIFSIACTFANSQKIGTVFIPSGVYLVDQGFTVSQFVNLEGVYTSLSNTDIGTVLWAGSTSTNNLITFSLNSSTFSMKNINFVNYTTTTTRHAVRVFQAVQEWHIENCNFMGFTGYGILLDNSQDGSIINTRFNTFNKNPNDTTIYANLGMLNTGTVGCNAIRVINCHFEASPKFVYITNAASSIEFIGCKFESAFASYAIDLSGVSDVIFSACEMVQVGVERSVNELNYYSSYANVPYYINIGSGCNRITFGSCNFFSNDTSTNTSGVKWLTANASSYMVTINGCTFNTCYATTASFQISTHSVISNNSFVVNTSTNGGGVKNFITFLGRGNKFSGNKVYKTGDIVPVVSGNIYYVQDSYNDIVDNNIYGLVYFNLLSGSSSTYINTTNFDGIGYPSATLYVSTSGNDTNGGTSVSSPFATIAKALSVIGSNGVYDVEIRLLSDTTENISISGIAGRRNITISGYDATGATPTTRQVGYINIQHCNVYTLQFNNIKPTATTTSNAYAYNYDIHLVIFYNCDFSYGTANTNTGVYAIYGMVLVSGSSVSFQNKQYGIFADKLARVQADALTMNTTVTNGLYASRGIIQSSQTTLGSTTDFAAVSGGLMVKGNGLVSA